MATEFDLLQEEWKSAKEAVRPFITFRRWLSNTPRICKAPVDQLLINYRNDSYDGIIIRLSPFSRPPLGY